MGNNSWVFVFPGQGSQKIGMGLDLAALYPTAREIFTQADTLLGYPLSEIAWHGPEETLNNTAYTQPALFTHSIASLRVLQELLPDLRPQFVAGHSMGQISALVASGSLSFLDGLNLVRLRGHLMQKAGEDMPGSMVAVLGLNIPTIEAICAEVSTPIEIVQVANDNCPGQVVISGANAAIDRAIPLLQLAGARRAVRLPVSIASHSTLMHQAQQGFSIAVDAAPLLDPEITIIGNVTAQPLHTSRSVRQDLKNQLTYRVRWTESIQYIGAQNAHHYVEIGTGSVLSGLIKRIDQDAQVYTLGTPDDINKLQSAF